MTQPSNQPPVQDGSRTPGFAWPLRSRLVALLVALVAIGLLVAGSAAVAALRGYLMTEVDRGLVAAVQPFMDPNQPLAQRPPSGGAALPGQLGREVRYVRVSSPDGTGHQVLGDPDLVSDPPILADLSTEEVAALEGEPYTVESESGATRWRVLSLPLVNGSGSVSIAVDMGVVEATVGRLVLIELAVGLVVVLLIGVAGWVLVRRSLRPLDDVERAAATIAAGDRSVRAPGADPRTEVGSLAQSFNTMVDTLTDALTAEQAAQRAARESAEVAQASEARMRQFVADASHELRTPLTSVRGFAELYRLGAVAPGTALDDAMGRIESEAHRMGLLVEDLLLLARLDEHRPLDREPVNLLDLAGDAAAAARATAPGRDVVVEVDRDAPEARALGDAARLRQVIDNLVSNALRYSPVEEPVRLRVGVVEDAAGRWAQLEVTDRGPGMDPEEAARAFERFYRADPARSRTDGGAGLGLAIVAAITSAHGGRVAVRTRPGAGATFAVQLPLADDPRNNATSTHDTTTARASPSGGTAPGTGTTL